MKKLKILIALVCLVGLKSFAQNADISYAGNSTLCNVSSCCNVFNQSGNNPTVGGFKHWPVSGGATFDGTTVNMQTTNNSTTDNGTAYAFEYSFKTGFTYAITADVGYSSNPTTAIPRIDFSYRTSLPSPANTNPTACGPVSGSKYVNSIGTPINFVTLTQTAVKTYTVSSSFTVNANQSFLVITAYNGGANGSVAKVSKIKITETSAVLPSVFTFSPTSVTIPCGTSVTRTFTVTNVNNSPGTIVYNWNLGSPNNGWLYNGNPAPQTISTTSNTISLTSVATATTVSNVSVTPNLNGLNLPTLTSTVSLTTPGSTFTISGSPMVCTNTSSTYTLQQTPPAGAVVTWSIYPDDGSFTLTPNGNSVTLNPVNVTANNFYNLTVSVLGNCYQGSGFSQFFIPAMGWAGGITGYQGWSNAVYSGSLVEGDNYLYLGNGATWFEAQLNSAYFNGVWSNVWWEHVSGDYTPYANSGIYRIGYDLSSYGGSNGYVDSYYNFHYTDECGTYSIPFHFMQSYSSPPSYRMQQPPKEVYKLSITPNPANAIAQLRVLQVEENKIPDFKQFDYSKPVSIRIYDKLGIMILQQFAVIPKTGLKLNVAMLRHADFYNIVIDDGKGIRISGKLLKQ